MSGVGEDGVWRFDPNSDDEFEMYRPGSFDTQIGKRVPVTLGLGGEVIGEGVLTADETGVRVAFKLSGGHRNAEEDAANAPVVSRSDQDQGGLLPQCEHVDPRYGRCKLAAGHPTGPVFNFHPDVRDGHVYVES